MLLFTALPINQMLSRITWPGFYFDPNSIAMVSDDTHVIFGGYTGTSTLVLRLQFQKSLGAYKVQAALLDDASTWQTISWFTISEFLSSD